MFGRREVAGPSIAGDTLAMVGGRVSSSAAKMPRRVVFALRRPFSTVVVRADQPPPLLNGRLPGATALFDALADELNRGDPFAEEAADSLARLILVRLARQRLAAASRRLPLSPAQLQRLRDFVQAHLESRLLVTDLAAVVGLPPNRFAQAFVVQTGLSPHQFVLQQRLDRAQAMLLRGTERLADVAAACGFASQQHLTASMRRRLGITPGRLRGAQRAS